MAEVIIITPVKNSITTTLKTIEGIYSSSISFEYYVFNDFSTIESKTQLVEAQKQYGFNLIHLEDLTSNPSPNYKLVLQMAQKIALDKKLPLVVIESDVIIKPDTLQKLLATAKAAKNPALVGAITVDNQGNYNFPYNFEKKKSSDTVDTSHSISFCCTLMTVPFLQKNSFDNLSHKKDWYDVFISRKAKKEGFRNYLAKDIEVLHLPHSSRPWKNLKYSKPLVYYWKKLIHKRDRI